MGHLSKKKHTMTRDMKLAKKLVQNYKFATSLMMNI